MVNTLMALSVLAAALAAGVLIGRRGKRWIDPRVEDRR